MQKYKNFLFNAYQEVCNWLKDFKMAFILCSSLYNDYNYAYFAWIIAFTWIHKGPSLKIVMEIYGVIQNLFELAVDIFFSSTFIVLQL